MKQSTKNKAQGTFHEVKGKVFQNGSCAASGRAGSSSASWR
jgi:uncharacterized protein YjbJ (UPF0337 family)